MITKTAIVLFVVLLMIYLGLGLILYLQQNKIIYYPTNQDFDKCSSFDDAEKLRLDGTRAYYKSISSTLVIFYHGNAGSACDRTYIKRLIETAGHSYLIVEYAGYSNDNRRPSKDLLLKDAENVAKFVGQQDFERVLVMGESLGSAIAAHHANVGKYDAMLLITPFDSISGVAQRAYPFYPVKRLLKEDYDNMQLLKDKNNVWIVHGTNDKVIPMEHSRILFESLQGQGNQYHEIPGAAHNDLFGFGETIKIINKFIK